MLRVMILCATVVLGVHCVEAQKEANHFGFYNFELEFTTGEAAVRRNFSPHQNRGMGVISDKDGNLLFYTDGFTVFNRSHNSMPNGASMLPLHSSTSTQESIVVPRPGSDNIYYIFTTDPFNGQASSGLYYSEVDLSLDGGMGDVTTKSVKLVSKTTNKLSACLQADGKGVWVMTHKAGSNAFVLLSVTEDGVIHVNEQSIGMIDQSISGQMKFSPDGQRIAISYANPEYGLIIFDFDASTGVLANPIEFSSRTGRVLTGALDFSSDAKKLYVTGTGSDYLGQLDLSVPDAESIRNSLQIINTRFIDSGPYQIQLAPDGKIYGTKGGGQAYGNSFLMVIDNPNDRASEVIVRENGLHLQGGDSFVGYTPNVIQNYLYQTSFSVRGNCENSPVTFELTNNYRADSVVWTLVDGTTSKSRTPSVVYNTSGQYTVKLDVFYAGSKKTISREITIHPVTRFVLGENQTVCDGTVISVDDIFDSYQWNTGAHSNSIKAQSTGWHKLTAKNEFGCVYTDSVFLNVQNLPVIDLPDSLQLNVDALTLDAGVFPTYSWSNDETTRTIDVSTTGWYSVLVEDEGGCKNAKSVFVYRPGELKSNYDPKWKWLNPTPSGLAGRDIHFVNDRVGFMINSEALLQTSNGGDTWNIVMQMPSARRIIFRDSIGYIIGDGGLIYRSTHLGTGWNRINAGFTDNLISISAINKDTIRITSSNQLFSSNDGGRSWQSFSVSGVQVKDSYFTSGKTGHVVGMNGIIRKTIDGGKTWNTKMTSNVTPSNFFRVTFVNANLGFATREHSELYRTTDGGETWTKTSYTLDAGYSIHFINESVGFIAGEHGAIHKTTDGGATWNWAGFDGRIWANNINSIFFIDEKHGFATGMRGRIIRTSDGGASWQPYCITYNLVSHLDFTTDTNGYALLWNSILRTENAGKDWTTIGNPEVSYISSIDFLTNQIGYAAGGWGPGYAYNLYKTVDGGETWQLLSHFQISNIRKVYFVNEQVGFASTGGTVKTTDGGQTWKTVSSARFGNIQFVSPLIGYASTIGTYYNQIYKTVDGGDTWSVVFEIADDITGLHFLNANEGYFVGDAAIMYKTDDGGMSWQRITVPYAYYIDVAFVTRDFGYILDDYGNLYKTKDGGKTWSAEYALYGLRKIQINKDRVYLNGDFGAILMSEVGLEALTMGPLLATGITDSEATISTSIKSTMLLQSVSVVLEVGRQSGNYNNSYYVGEYDGLIDTPLSLNLTNLEAGTRYYCRFKIVYQNKTLSSNELTFQTVPDISTITIETLSALNITESKATVEAFVRSTAIFHSVTASLEVGRHSGVYDMQYHATPLTGTFDRQLSFDLKNLLPGATYYCRLKLNSGPQTLHSDELEFETSMVTDIVENAFTDLKFYPNPTRALVTIEFPSLNEPIAYQLTGMRGEIHSTGTIQHMSTLDLSSVHSGIYILHFKRGAQQFVVRIMKE